MQKDGVAVGGVAAECGSQTEISYEKVLELALEIGVGLLSSGGSVSRVETAVDRICMAYGAGEVNVAAFPSMVIASVRTRDDREVSFMKRVYSSTNNLHLLEKYNQLSRDVCAKKVDIDSGLRRSFEISHVKPRDKRLTVLGAGLVSATYSVFFGGSIADCLPAFIVAFVMQAMYEVLNSRSLNAYATTFILSLLGGVLSISLCKLFLLCGLVCHGSMVMIGSIMILIPGLLMTNAVRDLFTGDLMSGSFQILNALLLTVVIAAGYGLSVVIFGGIADFVPITLRTGWQYYTYFLVSGTLGAASVSMFFNLNPKRLAWGLIAAFLTLLVYLGVVALMGEEQVFAVIFIATLFAAMFSEVLARVVKMPATVVLVPAIIALVPGSSLYYTVEAVTAMHTQLALDYGFVCLMTLLGIAVGVCVATIVFTLINPVKLRYYMKFRFNQKTRAEKYGAKGGAAENGQTSLSSAAIAATQEGETTGGQPDSNIEIYSYGKDANRQSDVRHCDGTDAMTGNAAAAETNCGKAEQPGNRNNHAENKNNLVNQRKFRG